MNDHATTIAIIAVFCIAFSITAESLGVYFRVIGSKIHLSSLGYSSHLRIATIGRLATTLGAPLLGLLVDQSQPKLILLVASVTCLVASFIILIGRNVTLSKGYLVFNFLNRTTEAGPVDRKHEKAISASKKFYLITLVSYLIFSQSIFLVNYIAVSFPDNRATIVQMAALASATGTLIHVLFVDPKMARAADGNPEKLLALCDAYIGARISTLALFGLLYVGMYYGT